MTFPKSKIRILLAFALALSAALPVLAQSVEDVPEELKAQTLFVSIRTSVTGVESAGWNARSIRQTLSGTPVVIKLTGANVVILVQITSYVAADRRIVVVAQSQVTFMKDDKAVSRSASMYTVTVKSGEAIVFYPMGLESAGATPASEAGPDANRSLKVEIVVEDYETFRKRSDAANDPAAGAAPVAGSEPPKAAP